MNVLVPVSWGELLDKITILEIKSERIGDPAKRANVDKELAELNAVVSAAATLDGAVTGLVDRLREINGKLWDIEDDIRLHERDKRFDQRFIELARSVYFTNDDRARVKKDINLAMGSAIVEEKSYEDYS